MAKTSAPSTQSSVMGFERRGKLADGCQCEENRRESLAPDAAGLGVGTFSQTGDALWQGHGAQPGIYLRSVTDRNQTSIPRTHPITGTRTFLGLKATRDRHATRIFVTDRGKRRFCSRNLWTGGLQAKTDVLRDHQSNACHFRGLCAASGGAGG